MESRPPYIAHMENAGKFVGTAFAVGPRTLLTCWHVAMEFQVDLAQACANFDKEAEAGQGFGRFPIMDWKGDKEEDIALLTTDRDLPFHYPLLVDEWGAADLKLFVQGKARVIGYAGASGGETLLEVPLSAITGIEAEEGNGPVTSFQVNGGIREGMSGSPCVLISKGSHFIIGMAQTGGKFAGHSRLVSSNKLIHFLGLHQQPSPCCTIEAREMGLRSRRSLLKLALVFVAACSIALAGFSGKLPIAAQPSAELTIQLSQPAYREGDYMSLTVTSPEEGYLYVTAIEADGNQVPLYPSKEVPSQAHVAAGKVLHLPEDLPPNAAGLVERWPVQFPPGFQGLNEVTESIVAFLSPVPRQFPSGDLGRLDDSGFRQRGPRPQRFKLEHGTVAFDGLPQISVNYPIRRRL